MSWTMKRLHLIFIALVLWGDADGFEVWNRTSIGDWPAGHFNTTGNQNFQLATRVQPFGLLDRKDANGNVGEGNSGSALLTSEVQTAEHDSSFVQSSGGPENYGTLLSQSQSAATTNQAYGSQTQSSYQLNSIKPVSASQTASTFQFQPMGGSTMNQGSVSSRYNISKDKRISSCFQSVLPSNQISRPQTQSYQPSTTTQVSAGQSASTSQAQSMGATLNHGRTSGRYLTSLDQSISSSSQSVVARNQISGSQIQSYQPSTTTWVSAGQSASQAQSIYGAETPGPAKWYPILPGQMIPSNSQVSEIQMQSLPSSTQVWAGQSASTSQAQSMGASTLYQSLTSGRYLTSLDQSIPSSSSQAVVTSNQISGPQNQTSYRPSTTTQVSAGQSTSTSQAQSMGASALYQSLTSGRYLTSLDQSIPSSSSQAVVTSNQISGPQNQTSYRPSTTTQVSAGQSTSTSQAQSMGASALYQSLTSGRYLTSLDQSIPSSSSQAVVTSNKIFRLQNQTSYQPISTTPVLSGQSASASQMQSLNLSTLVQWQASSRYRTLPSFSQSGVSTNQISGFQTHSSYQPSTTTQVWAGQPATTSQAQSSLGAETPGPAKWYTILLGQMTPSSSQVSGIQMQPLNLPSSMQVWAGQSASTPQAQSMGASALYQALTSGRYLTSLDQSIPSSQPAILPNQMSGFQTQSIYQPSTTVQVLAGHSAIAQAQSLGSSYPSQTSGRYTILQGQINPPSSQVSGFQTQSSYQDSAASQESASQSDTKSQAYFQRTLHQ
ncbi:uncharacterized protein LOC131366685 isoform X2 [Hemibagrus wyckioides]|uniref:uncharacterized protein LOC131366685 isoform X2 n=1 Tax=Hemibagrus wyckioides TaxID=337641 RepID=UPI00266CAA42|nr:uncharacterized protein LOC131366685 isoform X2 [Hemibagrus wyckioides]